MNPMYSGHNTFERPTNPSAPFGEALTFADRKGGFPHSEMSGSKGARASPDLIAACHVLHRLSMPRHPSEALSRLIVLSKTHARRAPALNPGPQCGTCASSFSQTVDVFFRPALQSPGLIRSRADPSFTMSLPCAAPWGGARELRIPHDRK